MNLMFWKKKKLPEENAPDAADETIVAGKTDAAPEKPGLWIRLKKALSLSRKSSEPVEEEVARHNGHKHPDKEVEEPPPKPGFLTRLKIALLPSRKKTEPDEEEKGERSARRKDDKHPNEETDAPPAKPGFLARLKKSLMPASKKKEPAEEEKPEENKSTAKRTDRNHPDEEPQTANVPEKKPMKRLVIFLSLLIPLAAGGGFFAATKLVSPRHPEVPAAKPAALQDTKTDGQPASEPPKTAEHAPPPETEQPPSEPLPSPAVNTPPIAEAPQPPAEEPVAEAPVPTEEDIQAQIQAMKKHNQEMQAQIEALKKQPAAGRPARSAASAAPREGVLIINGKDTKESVQGLKQVIESMNAASGAKESEKK